MSENTEVTESSGTPWMEFLGEIRKECLTQNFGTLSKSEFDLLVFHYFLLELKAGTGDAYVSDYEIGKRLGLTIQRVRSLREREALKFGFVGDWRQPFKDCLKLAHCDAKGNIKIPIPDVNVIKEVRNYLEEHGLYDDFQLNPKVFQCELHVLVAICLDLMTQGQDFLGKQVIDELRACKDGSISDAVKEHEHPILANLKMEVIEDLRDFVGHIPVLKNTCAKMLDQLLKIAK